MLGSESSIFNGCIYVDSSKSLKIVLFCRVREFLCKIIMITAQNYDEREWGQLREVV